MKILIVIDQHDNLSNGTTINHKINDKIYTYFRSYYNKFRHIHCPSNFIGNQLKDHGYTAKLHVLIEAVKKSKYSDKIQLILGGKGQLYKEYVELSKSLKNPPIMKFLTKEELIDVLSYTDIYVHSADAEIEAISCLEAIASGNVPIISNSSESATVQFAMDEESLFEHGNSEDLAKKIDYYLDNPKHLEDHSIIFKILSSLLYLIAYPILFIVTKLWLGLKIEGRENLSKKE